MTTKATLQPVEDQWQVHVYMVSRDQYSSLDIVDEVYPNWIVSHVLDGEVTSAASGEARLVRSGEVMIHPPFLPFSERSSRAGTHEWISLEINGLHNLDLFRIYPVPTVVRLQSPKLYSGVFEGLLKTWRDDEQPFRSLSVTTEVLRLVAFILDSWHAQGRPERTSRHPAGRERFFPLVEYMAQNLHVKLARETLAERVHLNPNYFDRAFMQAYGVSPMQMLREMRLSKARQLLEATDDPLSAIAVECGFGDAPYLCRQFVTAFGTTPGKYRESTRVSALNYLAKS